jgi:DNA repair protein RecO (recombination protein O)
VDTRAERLQAFVLRTLPYGESDVIAHLLVQGRGRVSAFARGARKSVKRFGGSLAAFQLIEVLLAERRSAELLALREATLIEPYLPVREDLHRIAHAGYAAELASDLTRASEPADAIFALVCQFFTLLSSGSATSARLRALELTTLGAAGLAPELSACARCGLAVPPGRVAFDPAAGGVACARCAAPSALLLTAGARAAIGQLQRRGLAGSEAPLSADGSGRPADARAFEEASAQAARPLAEFLAHHVGHRPRTIDFFTQVGAPR